MKNQYSEKPEPIREWVKTQWLMICMIISRNTSQISAIIQVTLLDLMTGSFMTAESITTGKEGITLQSSISESI
jgi:hypothetical protein